MPVRRLGGSYLARATACTLLLVAFARMPYGYYTFLRIFLVLVLVHAAYRAFQRQQSGWALVLGIAAFAYNPVFRQHFGRGGWQIVNAVTILVLISFSYVERSHCDIPRVENEAK